MPRLTRGYVLSVPPRSDGQLSLVQVEPGLAVLSNGVELVMNGERLQGLAEQLVQEQAAVSVVTWINKDGDEELMQCRRVGEPSTSRGMDPYPTEGVF